MYDRDTLKEMICHNNRESRMKGMAKYYMSELEEATEKLNKVQPISRIQNNSTLANVSRHDSIEVK